MIDHVEFRKVYRQRLFFICICLWAVSVPFWYFSRVLHIISFALLIAIFISGALYWSACRGSDTKPRDVRPVDLARLKKLVKISVAVWIVSVIAAEAVLLVIMPPEFSAPKYVMAAVGNILAPLLTAIVPAVFACVYSGAKAVSEGKGVSTALNILIAAVAVVAFSFSMTFTLNFLPLFN